MMSCARRLRDLEAIGARWAVIGGLAVAFRAEPRFTKDVDLVVAVADDREAEEIVNRLQVRGYALASLVEQDYVSRLSTAGWSGRWQARRARSSVCCSRTPALRTRSSAGLTGWKSSRASSCRLRQRGT